MKMEINKEKLPRIISTTIVTILILIGTVIIVLYARGYRFNQNNGLVERTGVLDVDSNPNRSDIYIDDELFGRSPKTISSIPEGKYKVEVIKDNYHPWKSVVEIRSEKSTPITPYLYMDNPENEVVFEFTEEVVGYYNPPETNFIFVTTKQPLQSQVDPTDDQPTNLTYKIWRYNTNPSFWSAADNPMVIYQIDSTLNKGFELHTSPSGEYAIVKEIRANSDPVEPDITTYTLIDTSNSNSSPTTIPLDTLLEGGTWNWAKDEAHLVLENDINIRSYNLSNEEENLIKTKENPTTWDTDEDGSIYFLDYESDVNEIPYMVIKQMPLNGQSESILVDRIYYNENTDQLISESELEKKDGLYEFTNSPNASQFVGTIRKFTVENDIDGIILETEFATYLLDTQTNKYTIVSTIPSSYIRLSPDENKLLTRTADQLRVFIFDKEDADHVTKLGSKTLTGFLNGRKAEWLGNSKNLVYLDGENFKGIDINAANNLTIINAPRSFYAIDNEGENVFTILIGENDVELLKAKIN